VRLDFNFLNFRHFNSIHLLLSLERALKRAAGNPQYRCIVYNVFIHIVLLNVFVKLHN